LRLARPAEYYAFTIVLAIGFFTPIEEKNTAFRLKFMPLTAILITLVSFIFLTLPYITNQPRFLPCNKKTTAVGLFKFQAKAHCEVAMIIGAKDKWFGKLSLRLFIRCQPEELLKISKIYVAINEKVLLQERLELAKINVVLHDVTHHLHVGANVLTIGVGDSSPFTVTIQPF
jgi:hypothetical protein